MIVGHYAAALLPYSRLKQRYPQQRLFWLLLLCANVPEFLWLLLALLGVEPVSPPGLLDASFQNLQVAMVYSHNLLPGLLQGLLVGGLVWAVWRQRELALWCGLLCFFHVLSDLVIGFEHQLLGPDSPQVSLNSYALFPHAAILLELLFSLACVAWYRRSEARRGRPLAPARLKALVAVFSIGVLMWLPAATLSLREQARLLGL